MNNSFRYEGDLVGGSLMVRESRVVASLLLEKANTERWDQVIRVENQLQKRSPSSAKRNANAIRKRLEKLSPDFWRALREGDEDLAKQVSFCAALERNLLLVEFMETVVRDAYITHSEKLEMFHWHDFLENCANRDSTISNWTELTRKKMGQVTYRMLVEMGYLKSTRNPILQHVVIRPEIRIMLDDHYKQRIKRCMEVSYRGF